MNKLNDELDRDDMVRLMNILESVIYQKKREKEIVKIVDYLKEQEYLMDLCLIEDAYEILFREVYDFMYSKNLVNQYYNIMSEYIIDCLIEEECLNNKGNLDTFLKNLNRLTILFKNYHIQLQEQEILKLKKDIKVKKYNRPTLTH